ncbi:MAG: dockerin type I domain-containing protein, partial [Bacteroidota bacterium]
LDLLPDTLGFGPEFPPLAEGLGYQLTSEAVYEITGGTICDVSTASYVDREVDVCTGQFTRIVERLWTFADVSGNLDTCSQLIYVQSATIDLIQRFDVFDAECLEDFDQLDENGFPTPEETGFPKLDSITNANICGNLKMTYEDVAFPLCGKSIKLARKWSVIDWCADEVGYFDQIIRIEDKTPPIITVPVADFKLDSDPYICGQQNIDVPIPEFVDCDPDVRLEIYYETVEPDGNMIFKSNGENLRIPEIRMNDIQSDFDIVYILTDGCGNVSSDTATVTITDTEPPVAVCNQLTVISVNGSGEAAIRAETFDDLSVDNCGIASYEARKLTGACYVDEAFSENVRFCCEEVGDTILVEFKVTDRAGNFNTCHVEVYVQDRFRPLIMCPADIVIDCGTDYLDSTLTGIPEVRDNCGDIELIMIDEKDLNTCGEGTILRRWSVIDRGGFEELCTQVITITEDDPFGQSHIMWPTDTTITGCQLSLDPTVLGSPVLDMSSCVNVDASHDDLVFYDVEDACLKILREWTVVDWCQLNDDRPNAGIWKENQIIKLHSEIGPIITSPSFVDFCINSDDCETDILYTAEATDEDRCTPDDELIWSYVLRQGDEIIASGDGPSVSTILPAGVYEAIFTVTDACSNTTTGTVLVTVRDCAPPKLNCPAVQPALVLNSSGFAVLDLADVLISATDNCTDSTSIIYSFDVSTTVSTQVYTCADLPDGIQSAQFAKIYGKDLAGNVDSCEVLVQLFDNSSNVCADSLPPTVDTALVSGFVSTATLIEMEGVSVTLTNQSDTVSTLTNEFGEFSFEMLPLDITYDMRLSKKGNILEGVSTADIVLIQRFLLGLKPLDSHYSIIAADANNDGRISGTDLVFLRNALLGRVNEFPNNQRIWRFVDAQQSWPSGSSPFPFRDEISITPSDDPIIDADFMAVKIGDVNNSNPLSSGKKSYGRSTKYLKAVRRAHGIDLVTRSAVGLMGLQLGLAVEGDITAMTSDLISLNDDHYELSNNELKVSWSTGESVIVPEGQVILSIHGVSAVSISDVLSSEWIESDYSVSRLQLQVDHSPVGEFQSEIYPNPFDHELRVVVHTDEPGTTDIALYHIS